jgi:lipoprotein-anchoring transpeptidase ErfK/SrfK
MGRARWAAVGIVAVFAAVSIAACATPRGGQGLPLVRVAAPKPAPRPPDTVLVQGFNFSRPAPPEEWPVVDPNVQLGPPPYHVAVATVPVLHVFDSPTAAAPRLQLSRKTEHGLPRVLLTVAPEGDRWKVLLPVRPNGAVGWVPASEVFIDEVNYWVRVQTSTHMMTVGNGAQLTDQEAVAVGTGGTPTPVGTFYVTELIRPVGQPYYGPYAYTLSAHSNVLRSFMGGDGTIGMHGTNSPGSIGRAVSHGCIRVSNGTITKLAATLPLGTPVFVTP